MKVELIDSMGTDLTVVNAARVSFGKKKEKFEDGDAFLIRYLAKHNHWSPFGHCMLQFHIKAPVFVARQLVKHQVGLVWNEISRRYVDTVPEFYVVDKWRGKPVDKKQGSDGEVEKQGSCSYSKQMVENNAIIAYNDLLNAGVAPEQARMVLPQSLMTEWYWSGATPAFSKSLYAIIALFSTICLEYEQEPCFSTSPSDPCFLSTGFPLHLSTT
jgi:thymidylate synthase (FAD)